MKLVLFAAAVALTACAGEAVRRPVPEQPERRAGVLAVRWRTEIHEHGLFEGRREECASGAVVDDRLVIGSRGGRVAAVARDSGRILWSIRAGGGVDSPALADVPRGQVYVGSDDGSFYALDPKDGRIRWTATLRGSPERAPALGPDALFVATGTDRIYSLSPSDGQRRWQYERETPEGFTIHGHAGPTFAGGSVYAGFSDGHIVALDAASGDVRWTRPLSGTAEQFLDVDTTPAVAGELVIGGSYTGGLFALSRIDGNVAWRLPIEGAGSGVVSGARLYFAAPRDGLHAIVAETGEILWRQGLAESGDVTAPQLFGPYVLVSGSRGGLFVLDRESGRLLETFDPGDGVCAAATPAPEGGTLYVLANSGALYALAVAY